MEAVDVTEDSDVENTSEDDNGAPNILRNPLYLPLYWERLVKLRLPYCTLWSRILSSHLDRLNTKYALAKIPAVKGRNRNVDAMANGVAENLFKSFINHIEMEKIPIPDAIEKLYKYVKNQHRHWYVKVCDGLKKEKPKETSIAHKNAKKVMKQLQNDKSPEKDNNFIAEPSETWSKKDSTKVRNNRLNGTGAYRPNNIDNFIGFDNGKKESSRRGFKEYCKHNRNTVNSKSMEDVNSQLYKDWIALSVQDKNAFAVLATKKRRSEHIEHVCNLWR